MGQRPGADAPATRTERSPSFDNRVFFVAHRQTDGTYDIALTEDGIRNFETALGVAEDLGGRTRISQYSTIADIMERTATREELSEQLRQDDRSRVGRIRSALLRRRLRGSEKPSARESAIGHIGKALIVAVIAAWALRQFALAFQDIADIPSIVANIPSDILHLHPTSAIGEVSSKISDAGHQALLGVIALELAYIAAKILKPLGRIYRMDQIIPGERSLLKGLNRFLKRVQRRSGLPAGDDTNALSTR
ncbi:MAG: hypothetical protein NVS2B16_00500 [Chloroflexota bacterium]